MFQIDGVVYNAKELFGRCEACFTGGTLALGFIRGGSEITPKAVSTWLIAISNARICAGDAE